ncbi:MAG: hypothetical protein GY810_31855 [Aureispira sp.]|nr:hypothetical protein [Aureispira sp.]
MLKKLTLLCTSFSLLLGQVNAQSVGIGTATPQASAKLEISATDAGLLIPQVSLVGVANGTTPVNTPATGLLVWNTNVGTTGGGGVGFYYWDGAQWVMLGAASATPNTLDQAYDQGGAGVGRLITSDAGPVEIDFTAKPAGELSGLKVNSSVDVSAGIQSNQNSNGVAIMADVFSTTSQFSTIQARNASNYNVGANIYGAVSGTYSGSSGNGYGLIGEITATSGGFAGARGTNLRTTGGVGVYGQGFQGTAGETSIDDGIGVYGRNYALPVFTNAYGVYGASDNGAGVGGVGVWGIYGGTTSLTGYAVVSDGDCIVTGNLAKAAGTFKIDHPQDPANKYLYHSFVESPDMMNIYNGVTTLDANGEATVSLPAYFEDLNIDFKYQLTAMGASMPNLYIAEEVQNNSFRIAGGKANGKVSWEVTGVRNDPYAQQNRVVPEVAKSAKDKGKYLHPDLYNQPASKSIFKKEGMISSQSNGQVTTTSILEK